MFIWIVTFVPELLILYYSLLHVNGEESMITPAF